MPKTVPPASDNATTGSLPFLPTGLKVTPIEVHPLVQRTSGGVRLDTLIVRTVIVPALPPLIGDRFWWPARPRAAEEGPGPRLPKDATIR